LRDVILLLLPAQFRLGKKKIIFGPGRVWRLAVSYFTSDFVTSSWKNYDWQILFISIVHKTQLQSHDKRVFLNCITVP